MKQPISRINMATLRRKNQETKVSEDVRGKANDNAAKPFQDALPPDVSPTAHPTQSSDVILYASVLQQAVRYATHKSVPMRTLKPAKFKHTLPRGAVEKLKQGRILRRNLKRKFQNAPTEESRISPEFLLVKQNRKEVRAELRRAERTRRNKLYTRIC